MSKEFWLVMLGIWVSCVSISLLIYLHHDQEMDAIVKCCPKPKAIPTPKVFVPKDDF